MTYILKNKKNIYLKYFYILNLFYYLEFTSCSPVNYQNLIIKIIISLYKIDLRVVEIIKLVTSYNNPLN